MDYMCCVCDHQALWCITEQKRILPRRYCLVMSCFLFHLESYTHFLRAAAIPARFGVSRETEHKKFKRKLSFKTHQRETVHYKGFSLELRARDVNENSKSFHTVYWTSMHRWRIHRSRWYNVVRPILEGKGLTPGFDTLTWEILFILCPLQT